MIHSINQQGKALCFTLFYIWLSLNLSAQEITETWITENYHKKEVMIPMRDDMLIHRNIRTTPANPKSTYINDPDALQGITLRKEV